MRNLSQHILAGLILGACAAGAQDVINNVQTVNVTPGSFSVVAALSPPTLASNATISVYADAGGTKNLAGQVGIEYYPLNTGAPTATSPYGRLLSEAALRQDSASLGMFEARVSYCATNTTYYYRISATDGNGVTTVWPPSGPLPSATTALENSFAIQSQILLVALNGSNPVGSIITLSNVNSSSVLAAVVGDGAPTNQAFFNVNDLIAASGGTNFSATGSQVFTASLLGISNGSPQNYTVIIPTNFGVGTPSQVNLGLLTVTVGMGVDALLTGTSGSVPIYVASQSSLVNLSFALDLPTNLFSALSVEATSPLVNSAALRVLSANSIELSFATGPGENLEGTQQIAQLNFTTVSNQSSAFVQLWPRSPQGTNADASLPGAFYTEPGRIVIIGPQPLMDMQLEGTARSLVLYGIPGDSYQIQSSTAVARPGDWSDFLVVAMTNLMQVFPSIDPTPVTEFFRAYRFEADPPIIGASRIGTNRAVLAYGIPGTNYNLQVSSNLSATVVWHPLLNYTLTNSFQYFTNLGNTNSPVFYRIQKN